MPIGVSIPLRLVGAGGKIVTKLCPDCRFLVLESEQFCKCGYDFVEGHWTLMGWVICQTVWGYRPIPAGRRWLALLLSRLFPMKQVPLSKAVSGQARPLRGSPAMAGCPKCGGYAHHSSRHGWRDFLWQLIGQYPFRCAACGLRFYRSQRH